MKLIIPILLIIFQSIVWAQETDPPADDSMQLKITAVKEELDLENVNIQSMGNNDQIMLEGSISDPEVLKKSEEIAGQYFSNVYNLLSVDKNIFSYQLKLVEYTLSDNDSNTPWDQALKESFTLNSPSTLLLFDQNEMETFLKTVTETDKGNPLPGKFLNLPATGEYQGTFSSPAGQTYKIFVQGFNLDNGFFKCNIRFQKDEPNAVPFFSKEIYCRNGEWIAVFGFQKLLYGQSSTEQATDKKDLLMLIQIQLLPESV